MIFMFNDVNKLLTAKATCGDYNIALRQINLLCSLNRTGDDNA